MKDDTTYLWFKNQKKERKKERNLWDMRNDSADFPAAQISRMQQMWSLAGTCRASYLVSLFKATRGQKENTACLKWQEQCKLSGAPGRQYPHYKMSAEENGHHKEICVRFKQIMGKL